VRRYLRLAAPAASFALVGGALLVFAPLPGFELRGGIATSGGYALALQIVLTLFLLGGVDDPLMVDWPSRDSRRRTLGTARVVSDVRRALPRFYLWRPLPALFLAFGVSTSLAVVLIGLLDKSDSFELDSVSVRHSELVLAAILTVTALLQMPRLAPGFLGWCAGFAAGSALAQLRFDPPVHLYTALSWLTLVVVLWGLTKGVVTLRRGS
jgi:hypothetical protein